MCGPTTLLTVQVQATAERAREGAGEGTRGETKGER